MALISRLEILLWFWWFLRSRCLAVSGHIESKTILLTDIRASHTRVQCSTVLLDYCKKKTTPKTNKQNKTNTWLAFFWFYAMKKLKYALTSCLIKDVTCNGTVRVVLTYFTHLKRIFKSRKQNRTCTRFLNSKKQTWIERTTERDKSTQKCLNYWSIND